MIMAEYKHMFAITESFSSSKRSLLQKIQLFAVKTKKILR